MPVDSSGEDGASKAPSKVIPFANNTVPSAATILATTPTSTTSSAGKAPDDMKAIKQELLQSRAQRKMLVKELKFVRDQLAYHRKQVAKVSASRTDMADQLRLMQSRVVEAETDKTKVMTRSVAEKHMLANEINALEDTFMAKPLDKETALTQAQTQVVMLRKEVRYLRNQFVSGRQELASERKSNSETVLRLKQTIGELEDKLRASNSQPHAVAAPSKGEPALSARMANGSTGGGGDESGGEGKVNVKRLRKQRDMFERENVALTRRAGTLQARVQQLENELLLKGNGDGTGDENHSLLSENLLSSQQDSVKLLKHMLDKLRIEKNDLKNDNESDILLLGKQIRELDDGMIVEIEYRKTLEAELRDKDEEIRQLRQAKNDLEIKAYTREENIVDQVGLFGSTLAKRANEKLSLYAAGGKKPKE